MQANLYYFGGGFPNFTHRVHMDNIHAQTSSTNVLSYEHNFNVIELW
jgi:hypothetical protein